MNDILKEKLASLCVLVVDDELAVVELLHDRFRRWCRGVAVASNGKEGLIQYEKFHPDFIITDVRMPIMDGLEMVRQIRINDKQTPIIVLSAFNDPELLREAIEAGVNYYLVKPFEQSVFGLTLIQMCDNRLRDRALLKENNAFVTAAKQSPFAMVLVDTGFVIEYVNPQFEALTMWQKEEIIGHDCHMLKGITEDESNLHTTLSTGEIYKIQTQFQRRNETSFDAFITIAPIKGSHNDILGYVGYIEDISKRVEREQEFKKQEAILIQQSKLAAMGEMIAMIAHQWRQPIATIGMGVNNMLVDIDLQNIDTRVFQNHLESISKEIKYLSDTIDSFRDFFRPLTSMHSVSLSSLFHNVGSLISKSFENNGVTFCQEISNDTSINVAVNDITQILLNLLSNAKDVLKERHIAHAKVVLRGIVSKDYLICEVSDNGKGISSEIQDKIFEPYFTTKEGKNGTGLGLYMSKMIAEKRLGGSLTYESTHEGACFTLKVPLG